MARTPESRNEVVIVGRLAALPEPRILPSGDVVVGFRVIVDRPTNAKPVPDRRPVTVDSLPCSCFGKSQQRQLRTYSKDDVVEVSGAMRRQFSRGPDGPRSIVDIEVASIRRLRCAPLHVQQR